MRNFRIIITPVIDASICHVSATIFFGMTESLIADEFSVPPGNTHVQWNPIRVFLDYKTLRWLSYMYLDICNTLVRSQFFILGHIGNRPLFRD